MSIHPSLRSTGKGAKQQTVLKRTERLNSMIEKKQWKEGDNVFGLPKIKTIRIKIKKEKAEKTPAAEGAAPAAAAGQPAAKAPEKKAAK
jgi:small basic protein (TIGR04137 family)